MCSACRLSIQNFAGGTLPGWQEWMLASDFVMHIQGNLDLSNQEVATVEKMIEHYVEHGEWPRT